MNLENPINNIKSGHEDGCESKATHNIGPMFIDHLEKDHIVNNYFVCKQEISED